MNDCAFLTLPSTVHQRIVLDVDLYEHALVGFTDIYVEPIHGQVSELRLHCSQCRVSDVCQLEIDFEESVGKITAKQKRVKPRLIKFARNTNEDIHFDPKNAEKQRSLQYTVQQQKSEFELDDDGLLTVSFEKYLPLNEKTAFRVYYQLIEPKAGVYFVDPQKTTDEEEDEYLPVLYTHNQVVGARLWFPCLDRVKSLCTFEFQITTSPSAVVVCTGDLTHQVLNESGTLKTSYFTQSKWPIAPRSICLAVGPFKVYPDPDLSYVTHFYLPNHSLEHVKHTVEATKRMFSCYEEYLGMSYTEFFGSYKQVFIDSAYSDISSYATMSIIDSSFILDPKIIDNTRDVRKELATAIARQFFGHFMYSKKWADLWLIVGVAGYLGLQFLQEEFGKNELRYFIYKEAKNLLRLETHIQPLYCTTFSNPAELLTPYLLHKSPIVIYMIDRLAQNNMKGLLNTFLQKCKSAGKRNLDHRVISTKELLQAVNKTYLVNLNQFADYWIYSTGIPQFDIHFTYDADRSVVALRIKQILSHPNAKPFIGILQLRLHETEGSFDQTLDIDKVVCNVEVQCRSKPRKKQRKKMFEEGLASVLDKEEDLELARIEIPIRWIRVDPDLDWLRVLKFQQKADMWMKQLDMDKDVVAQHEAITALTSESQKSNDVLAKFESILVDKHYFYQIRIHTAYTMSRFTDPAVRNQSMGVLMKSFKSKYYDEKMLYVKPNDFSDFADYFVKKEIPLALSTFIDETTKMTPLDIIDFLLELIKYNDDSKNPYSSTFYLSNLIKALGMVDSLDETERFVKIIKRLLVMDSLLPSYQQCISIESLLSLSNIMSKGKVPFDPSLFLQYFKKGRSHSVRVSAWKALLHALQSHVLVVAEQDTNDMEDDEQKDTLLIRTIEQAFFDELLSMIEGDKETPRFKHDVTEITIEAIQRCSSMLVLLYQDHAMQESEIQTLSPFANFLTSIRSPAKENRTIVDRIWFILRGPVTEFDFRMRFSMIRLYNAIWGNIPTCYSSSAISSTSFIGLGNIDVTKNVILDDELGVDNDVLSSKPGHGGMEEEEVPEPTPPKEKSKKRKRDSKSSSNTSKESSTKDKGNTATNNKESNLDEFEFKVPEPKKRKTTSTGGSGTSTAATEVPKETKVKVKVTLPKNEPSTPSSTAAQPVALPVRRSLGEEEEFTKKYHAEQKEARIRLGERGGVDKLVLIHMTSSNVKIYVQLSVNVTSDALFRSCPITAGQVSGSKGIVWFPLPGMEKVNLEPLARSVVENGEIAYWVAGNSLCIAYAKTSWSIQNEIRLLEPCSIIGKELYRVRNLHKSVGAQNVTIQRMKRLMLTIQTNYGDEHLAIDLYEKHFELLVERLLSVLPISSCIEVFHQLHYFQTPGINFSLTEIPLTSSDVFFRDYLFPGEIAYWSEGSSILLGTGLGDTPTEATTTTGSSSSKSGGGKKQNTIKLLAKCLVFGRIVTMNHSLLMQKSQFVDPVHFYERAISITVTDGRTGEEKLSFIATLYETTTADRIYETLLQQGRFTQKVKTWGQCIYFDSGDTVTDDAPMLPEMNQMREVVQPGELAYWCENATICMAYGRTEKSEKDEPRLLCPCVIWGVVTSHTSEEVKQLMESAVFDENDDVTVAKYMNITDANINFVRKHGAALMYAQQNAAAQQQQLQQQQQTALNEVAQ